MLRKLIITILLGFCFTPSKAAEVPHDLSPLGMYLQADWVVKTVMLGLLLASFLTWIIAFLKFFQLFRAKREIKEALAQMINRNTLPLSVDVLEAGVGKTFLSAAIDEINTSHGLAAMGTKERLGYRFARLETEVGRWIASGTGVLATIGSTAPFIGLFGTVWGIMNSFIGISKAQTTDLAVVAPGIAEALLATGMGLVAAIPAVMIYNTLSRQIAHYRTHVGGFAHEIMRLVSLHIDREEHK
ncbi:tonB-system energizer ExbB [Gilvimarinus agarilyticus]|nr:tonB-system energizer ExbB [Gilvimarinus agarilyticus]